MFGVPSVQLFEYSWIIGHFGEFVLPAACLTATVFHQAVGSGIHKIYQEMIESKGLKLRIVTECGRYITGPAGMLVSRVTHRKKIYKNYVSCLQGGVLKLQMG